MFFSFDEPSPIAEIVPVLAPLVAPLVVPLVKLAAKVGYFPCPAGVGNCSVTGVGFQPVRFMFYVAKKPGDPNDRNDQNSNMGSGISDAALNQNSINWCGGSGAPAQFGNRMSITKCISIVANGTVVCEAALASIEPDGFTLNFTAVNAEYGICWEAIA